jgi:hypothetical protein
MIRHIPFICFLLVCLITKQGNADILPPGHKSITHELVFESSSLFDDHCLVAAPIRGFEGVHIVVPGQRFHFSSKYGTRFYLIPESETKDLNFDRENFDHWPSTLPPVSQIPSVPVTSPVASAVTTLRFTDVQDGTPHIIVVDHRELDSSGKPASYWRAYWWLIFPVVGGVALLAAVFRRLRCRGANPDNPKKS